VTLGLRSRRTPVHFVGFSVMTILRKSHGQPPGEFGSYCPGNSHWSFWPRDPGFAGAIWQGPEVPMAMDQTASPGAGKLAAENKPPGKISHIPT
jgi:hypothetical protein